MGDFKFISKSEEQLQKPMHTNKHCSDNILKEFGIDNFAKIVMKIGKLVHLQNLILDINREI
jgi:hypothetical protein